LVTLDRLSDNCEAPPAEGLSSELRVKQDLARELHDGVAATLTAMVVQMETFKALESGRERMLAEVSSYQEATREVLTNIREILYELRGQEDLGYDFPDRVRRMLDRFQTRTGIVTRLCVSAAWPSRVAIMAAINLYRVLEEALNNVRMHSGAKFVKVSLRMLEGDLAVVSVSDDGYGFGSGLGDGIGLGMLGMRERALLLGGELTIESVSPHGTQLMIVIPKATLT